MTFQGNWHPTRKVGATPRAGRRRVKAAGILAIAGVLLASVACGQPASGNISSDAVGEVGPAGDESWQQLVAAAKAEGEVTIYGSNSRESLDELGKRFEGEYGIKVNVVREVDATIHQKLDAEQQTGNQVADMVSQATASWTEAKGAAGLFAEPAGPAFASADYDTESLLLPGGAFVSSATVMTYAWNTDLHQGGMTGYGDLLDPALAGGQIGVISPISGAILDFYNYLNRTQGDGFVEKLAAQRPRVYPSALAISQALGAGEIAAAAYVQPQYTQKAEGIPVDSGLAEEVWGAPFQTGILASAPHPNAAQVLANYMITPAGQEPLALRGASVVPNVATAITTIDMVAPQDLSVVTPQALDDFRREFDRLFT